MDDHEGGFTSAAFAEGSGLFSNWIGATIEELEFPGDFRSRLACACMHVALSHHVAIASLFRDARPSSACALLRPLIDSYVRGMWIWRVASDADIRMACAGNDLPGSPKLMLMLEEAGVFDSNTLTAIKNAMWSTACDFTHTGIRVLSRHLGEDEIAPSFQIEEIREVLGAADAWATMAALGLAGIAGDEELARVIAARGRKQAERLQLS